MDWETGLHAYLDQECADVLGRLAEKKAIEPDMEEGLKKALQTWNQVFQAD